MAIRNRFLFVDLMIGAVLLLAFAAATSCGGGASPAAAVDPPPTTVPVTPPAPVTPPPPPPPPPAPTTADIRHAVIVVEENKNYSDIIGNPAMPYVNSLGQKYGLATNYFGNGIDSLPDYFMLTVGDTISKGAAFSGTVTEDNVVREMVAAKKTWKAYAESLPSVGYLGGNKPPYVKEHNAFAYLSDVVNNKEQAENIVPFTQLATDLAAGALPAYAFIIPNNQSNSHDCPPNMSSCNRTDALQYADNWLKNNIGPLLADADFQQHGLLIITWDESRTDVSVNGGGHVATIVVAASVKPGFQSSTLYQHQSVLRLMMRSLGVTTYPNQAATAPDMSEFFSLPLP